MSTKFMRNKCNSSLDARDIWYILIYTLYDATTDYP